MEGVAYCPELEACVELLRGDGRGNDQNIDACNPGRGFNRLHEAPPDASPLNIRGHEHSANRVPVQAGSTNYPLVVKGDKNLPLLEQVQQC